MPFVGAPAAREACAFDTVAFAHPTMEVQMTKIHFIAVLLSAAAAASFAQTAAPAKSATVPAESASAPAKHKLLKKLKNHKPGAPAADPERSPDKKGGA